jgi:predicted amidohydrolase
MNIKVATSQFATIKDDFDSNLNKAIKLIEDAAKKKCRYIIVTRIIFR